MQAVRLVFRAELRRRWASWLLLSLLVALVSGAVLAGLAAGRATTAAFPRFVAKYGFDGLVYSVKPITPLVSKRDVSAWAAQPNYFEANVQVGDTTISSDYLSIGEIPAGPAHQPPPVFKLLSGRLPRAPDEVLVSFAIVQQYGLHVGSSFSVPFYSTSQISQVVNSNVGVRALGPTVRFHVVGIEASILDFPSGTPTYNIFLGPGFEREYGSRIATSYATYVRLRHGAADLPLFQQQSKNYTTKLGVVYFLAVDPLLTAVEGSIHPQAVGWWLLALLAGLGGLAIVGQALSRQALVEADTYPTLRALGLRPTEVFRLGLARAATIGAVGAAGGIAFAWLVSSFTPVGEARIAEPTQGLVFDTLVLPLGAITTVAVVVALGAIPAWRLARAGTDATTRRQFTNQSAGVATWLRSVGRLPSALVGIRRALERGSGRSTIPVVTATLGASLAVTALAATSVFGASLSNLTKTPPLYGQAWGTQITGNIGGTQMRSIVKAVERYPGVRQVSYGLPGKFLDVNGRAVQVLIADAARGGPALVLSSGRFPSSPGEIALGVTTMHDARTSVGSSVRVSVVPNGSGVADTGTMRVVGTVVFPPDLNTGGLGVGALVTIGGATAFVCQSSPNERACRSGTLAHLYSSYGWGILVGVAPDATGRATVRKLDHRYAAYIYPTFPPTDLVNFGEAVNFPLLLGIALALFGAATFVHLLVVSVARRRKDVALLKALGFVRRQIATAVCWQATTVALLAVAVGLPLGIAVGRVIWHAFAFNLGAVPVAVVPGPLIAVIAVAILLGANVLAALPAMSAARLHPARTLREA